MKREIPQHVAIIMDGNGRWAKKRFLPRTAGHNEGAKNLKKIIEHAKNIGIKYLTVYAFSTENWKRSEDEVKALMFLFKSYLKKEEKEFNEKNVKVMISGRRDHMSKDIIEVMDHIIEKTSQNNGITLNIAFNYGGRAEIIDAINKILESDKKNIDENEFRKYLYVDIPDPELVIRTSGEMRISNFLLWQIAYSEIYVTEKLWPEFSKEDLEQAISFFSNRERRFGGV